MGCSLFCRYPELRTEPEDLGDDQLYECATRARDALHNMDFGWSPWTRGTFVAQIREDYGRRPSLIKALTRGAPSTDGIVTARG